MSLEHDSWDDGDESSDTPNSLKNPLELSITEKAIVRLLQRKDLHKEIKNAALDSYLHAYRERIKDPDALTETALQELLKKATIYGAANLTAEMEMSLNHAWELIDDVENDRLYQKLMNLMEKIEEKYPNKDEDYVN